MRRLTEDDLANIVGSTVEGYQIEKSRIKRGPFTDSDHYGIVLGCNEREHYVTWQFHLDEDEKPSVYWGHYIEEREAAIRDFDSRDLEASPKAFSVTIIETLKRKVTVEAVDQCEAEQLVSDRWDDEQYILTADDFHDAKFDAVLIDKPDD